MIGSLFSGVGGLELGLEWAGLGPVAWQVEIDPFCRGVLAMHWPDAKRFVDVRAVGRDVLSQVDVICGGFPCQDVSVAGKGAGLAGAKSGLWREYLRIVRELHPRAVVVENVAALASRGLDRVVADLHGAGYRVEGRIIAAADVGAPHRRERLFLVAHAGPLGLQQRGARHDHDGGHALGNESHRRDPRLADAAPSGRGEPGPELDPRGLAMPRGDRGHVADADRPRVRFEQQWMPWGRPGGLRAGGQAEPLVDREAGGRSAEPGFRYGLDGLPRGVGRWPSRPGETQAPWEPPRSVAKGLRDPTRRPKIAALGNAVVPQVARLVGERVREILGR